MEIIWIVGGFVIGILLFLLINEMFRIYYWGFKGISATFMGCWSVGVVIMALFGAFLKWIVLIGVIIWGISKVSKPKGTKKKAA